MLGTVGYMSPEQVRGHVADARSDIFSLGCVVHEMLTGRRAFQRETAAETMTAILREDPGALPESCPPGLARVVERCLEKQPAERFQSARDLAFALASLAGDSAARSSVTGLAIAADARVRRLDPPGFGSRREPSHSWRSAFSRADSAARGLPRQRSSSSG